MESNLENWPASSACNRESQIDPKPAYQRGPVWSTPQKQLFIDSILRGFDVPKFYLHRIDQDQFRYAVVDGQQRLRAIWSYKKDEFPLDEESDPVLGHDIARKKYSELDPELKDNFEAYTLSVVVIRDADEDEIEEMFLRFQNGSSLNSAEKRNAISGQLKDYIVEFSRNHKFFTESVPFQNHRFSHHEVAAQTLLIEQNRRPISVKHEQLKSFYESMRTFNRDGKTAKRFEKVFNYLHRMFPQKNGDLGKANVLGLYCAISSMMDTYALNGRHEQVRDWFIGFERERQSERELDTAQRDPALMEYDLYLQQGTATENSLEYRQSTLVQHLLRTITDIKLLDTQRLFTNEQRRAIFRNSWVDGLAKCAVWNNNPDCEQECTWDNFEADHIEPHSLGGPSIVSNGQVLCSNCNQKKGNN